MPILLPYMGSPLRALVDRDSGEPRANPRLRCLTEQLNSRCIWRNCQPCAAIGRWLGVLPYDVASPLSLPELSPCHHLRHGRCRKKLSLAVVTSEQAGTPSRPRARDGNLHMKYCPDIACAPHPREQLGRTLAAEAEVVVATCLAVVLANFSMQALRIYHRSQLSTGGQHGHFAIISAPLLCYIAILSPLAAY